MSRAQKMAKSMEPEPPGGSEPGDGFDAGSRRRAENSINAAPILTAPWAKLETEIEPERPYSTAFGSGWPKSGVKASLSHLLKMAKIQ